MRRFQRINTLIDEVETNERRLTEIGTVSAFGCNSFHVAMTFLNGDIDERRIAVRRTAATMLRVAKSLESSAYLAHCAYLEVRCWARGVNVLQCNYEQCYRSAAKSARSFENFKPFECAYLDEKSAHEPKVNAILLGVLRVLRHEFVLLLHVLLSWHAFTRILTTRGELYRLHRDVSVSLDMQLESRKFLSYKISSFAWNSSDRFLVEVSVHFSQIVRTRFLKTSTNITRPTSSTRR